MQAKLRRCTQDLDLFPRDVTDARDPDLLPHGLMELADDDGHIVLEPPKNPKELHQREQKDQKMWTYAINKELDGLWSQKIWKLSDDAERAGPGGPRKLSATAGAYADDIRFEDKPRRELQQSKGSIWTAR